MSTLVGGPNKGSGAAEHSSDQAGSSLSAVKGAAASESTGLRRPRKRRVLLPFLVLALAHVVLAAGFSVSRVRDEIAEAARSDRIVLRQIASSLEATYHRGTIQLQHLDAFLRVLVRNPEDFTARRQDITNLFAQMLRDDPTLDQVRIIAPNGREAIRVDRTNGRVRIVPDDALQDKSGRPYFDDARGLARDAFYVSNLDLNIEDGVIEEPLKPTVRLARPYRTGSGALIGVVVLNIRPADRVAGLVGQVGDTQFFVTDSRGHWLFGAGADDFSHITRPDGTASTLASTSPDAWDRIATEGDGALYSRQGYFEFIRFMPLPTGSSGLANVVRQDGDAGLPFQAVAHIPAARIVALSPIGRPEFWALNAIVLAALGAAVWLHHSRQVARRDLVFALARERDAAVRAERFKSDFMAKMSHELRTPLNGILGILDVVVPELDDPTLRRELGLVRSSGRLLERLVADILDNLRIEQRTFDLRPEAFSPLETAQAVQATMSLLSEQEGTRIVVRCAPLAAGTYIGDRERLSQVLFNLVSNAVKFTRDGEIAIEIDAGDHGWLDFEVRDTGAGMDQAETDRIMARIREGHHAEVPTLRTYGLGLHIVWVLIKEMGGTLDLRSAPGQGTRARFRLPLPPVATASDDADDQTRAAAQAADADAFADAALVPMPTDATHLMPVRAPEMPFAGLRALVADDIPTNQLVLSGILRKLGFDVTVTGDGAEALAAWQPGAFDIVLLDIMMPTMDGLAALAAIRDKAAAAGLSDVAFVAVTANALPEQIADYLAAGFRACVTKPVSRAKLEAALSDALPVIRACG
ncbi:MAG: ATP-binding protein [Rhodobacteraceae bacterium]|nr:ATP-binding protein [Paracoccaceae bacterium]